MTKTFFDGYDLNMDPKIAYYARMADEILTGHICDIKRAGDTGESGNPILIDQLNVQIMLHSLMSFGQAQCLGHAVRAVRLKSPEKAIRTALTRAAIIEYIENIEIIRVKPRFELIGTTRSFQYGSDRIIFNKKISFEISTHLGWIRDSMLPDCPLELDNFGRDVVDLVRKAYGYKNPKAIITFKSVKSSKCIWNPRIDLVFAIDDVLIHVTEKGHCGQTPEIIADKLLYCLPNTDTIYWYKQLFELLNKAVKNALGTEDITPLPYLCCKIHIDKGYRDIGIWSDSLNTSLNTEHKKITRTTYSNLDLHDLTVQDVTVRYASEIQETLAHARQYVRRQKMLHRKNEQGALERCMVTERIIKMIQEHDEQMASDILCGKTRQIELPTEVFKGFLPPNEKKKHKIYFTHIEGRIFSSFQIKPGITWKINAMLVPPASDSSTAGLVGKIPEKITDHPISKLIGPVSSVKKWPDIMVIRFRKKIIKHAHK